jgi:hypothetical protein
MQHFALICRTEDGVLSFVLSNQDQNMANKEIEAGARLIAEDLQLPGGGSKKLARVVHNHLEWFDAAEARGMTWSDMIRLLSAAGALGKDGRRLTVGTLSSTVWRKRAEAESKKETTLQSARGTRSAKLGRVTTRLRPEKAVQNAVDRGSPAGDNCSSGKRPRKEHAASRKMATETHKPKNSPSAATRSRSETPDNPSAPKNDVLAFMNRAAAARRRFKED